METIISELLKIYKNTHKHKKTVRKIINNITNEYINKQMTLLEQPFTTVRQKWLARKYAIIWRLKVIEKQKRYTQFNLIDYSTWVRVVDVYDGDTFKVIMSYRGYVNQWTVRMNGYDSPEMKPLKSNPNRDKEKEAAKKARDALITQFKNHIFIRIVGFDKYGRLLVEAYNGKTHINNWMIQNGYGYPYDGGKKKSFSEEVV